MNAEIKCVFGTWIVVPHDGLRGGIVVSSRQAAIELCRKNNWTVVKED